MDNAYRESAPGHAVDSCGGRKKGEAQVAGWLGGALLVLWLAIPVFAQPAERFRLDVRFGYFHRPAAQGFLTAPLSGIFLVGPTDIFLTDVSAAVYVTERLFLSAGVPFGLVVVEETPGANGESKFGVGDVHAEASYHLLREGRLLPGIITGLEGAAPTGDRASLSTGLWRMTGRLSLLKSLHERFAVFADSSYSRFFERVRIAIEPIISYGGGVDIGMTATTKLALYIEEAFGGECKNRDQVVVPFSRDLRVSIGARVFSKGRERFAAVVGVGRLGEDPTFLFTLKWALLSFPKP